MDIKIQSGEGISQAIKRELEAEGATQVKGSIWSNIQQLFQDEAADEKSTLTHCGNKQNIGDAWHTLKMNVLVFVNDVLKISETTWNKIKELAGIGAEDSNIPARDSNPPEAIPDPTDPNPPVQDTTPPINKDTSEYILPSQHKNESIRNDDGTISTYDENGRLEKITYFEPDNLNGKPKLERDSDGEIREYEYDSNGNETKFVKYNSDGTVQYYYTSEYDDNGNKIKCIKYNSDGTVEKYNKNEYDSNGKETGWVEYNSDGTVEKYNKTEYDSRNGQRTNSITYNFNGTIDSYTKSEYDSSGNETRYISYSDGTIDCHEEMEYDDNGNEIKRVSYNSDGTIDCRIEMEYDDNGNEIKWIKYNSDGTIDCRVETEYTDGKKTKETCYKADGTVKYELKYDQNGNIII